MLEQLRMGLHPCFHYLTTLSEMGILKIAEATGWMGMYGADSPKPFRMWGTPTWMNQVLAGPKLLDCHSTAIALPPSAHADCLATA